ncbi:MAG: thioredoxin domain-containing protein [Spirochaetales bacterium]|nr:thioredoxin domain-containing protein [Spirochaetales bacterium]
MHEENFTNRLVKEKSPYLLQHADNPVEWFPWGDDAFEKARTEDKPIFLSIGYSTCHWCHVMAHESFEDPEIGTLMNLTFVSIKVDREERPDIDGVYMTVSQMMTGGGGWPLTILMTPDKKPFYAATYIPKEGRGPVPGMREFISLVHDAWVNRRDELLNSAEGITGELVKKVGRDPGAIPSVDLVHKTYRDLKSRYDKDYGGFNRKPKFPSPQNLLFLMRYWKSEGANEALEMVRETLDSMRRGGIYDHLGGGFHRYATDQRWNIPHFEKMLYDQALIAMAYTEACQITGESLYEDTVRGVLDYVLRDMTSPKGGFYSAEDADSEGEEGRFYTWSYEDLAALLGSADLARFTEEYSVKKSGNYKDEATGRATGLNILYREGESSTDSGHLEEMKALLFNEREKRIHPFKDDKILTDWNGLMIGALARAGKILNDDEYIRAAERAADFILEEMAMDDGTLYHRYRLGEKGITGYLEDYIFLARGLLALYEADFVVEYLSKALLLADIAVTKFWDHEKFGFFSTGNGNEALLYREKEGFDGAVPSGNSAAVDLFLRLGRVTGRRDLIVIAEKTIQAFSSAMEGAPSGYTNFASGLSLYHGLPREIIMAGQSEGGVRDPSIDDMVAVLREGYHPEAVTIFVPSGSEGDEIRALIPYLEHYGEIDGKAMVYVCSNYSCSLPTGDPEVMRGLLRS